MRICRNIYECEDAQMYGFGKPVKKKFRYRGRNPKRYASDEYGNYIKWRRNYAINSKRTTSQEELKLREITKQIFRGYIPRYNDRNQLKGLELDVFYPQLGITIEYNGKGHYKKNDILKHKLCFTRGIKLLIIKQIDNNYRIKRHIRNFLLNYNIHLTYNTKGESTITPTLLKDSSAGESRSKTLP